MKKALSKPVNRNILHERTVKCFGFKRNDGLYDIEGHLLDSKAYSFEGFDRGSMKAGDPVHEMSIRLTVDLDLNIKKCEAVIIWGPYNICDRIAPNFKKLEGECIKPGFTQRTKQLLGGVKGCTHLLELLGPIATTAFQTIYPDKNRKLKKSGVEKRPALINTCHAWASDSEMIASRYPRFFTENERKGS